MTLIMRYISPKSSSGSLVISVVAHLCILAAANVALKWAGSTVQQAENYLDLEYEMLEAPPTPVEEVRKMARSPSPVVPAEAKTVPDNSPKELQDEKSEIAGTQKAQEANNTGSQNNGDALSTPYYKIKPKYPKAALISGLEGWVLMVIDINENGEVENVRVIDGEQRNTFQSEARRAVQQWKYKPFVGTDGHPIRKADHQVRVDFKLEDATETQGG